MYRHSPRSQRTRLFVRETLSVLVLLQTGGLLNYRWYKEIRCYPNGGASLAPSATLTINPAVSGDASTDYHCVITNNCGNETSDYVELVVNAAATPAGTANYTDLSNDRYVTSVIGSFTASSSANGYLVVRTSTAAAPTNPSDGTTYSVGSTALGATTYVEYSGPFTNLYFQWFEPGDNILLLGIRI